MSNVKDLALFGDAITSTSTGIKLDEANALALSAYNKTIGTVAVDAFIYDTSKDSDGGAWRKRTEQTSWYNETLNTATRGSRREFPATAIIVIEATKMTIYDGDEPDCPMWMVFNYILGAHSYITYSDRSLSSVAALNGNIVLGGDDNVGANGHVHIINFLKDNHERYTGSHSIAPENISQRNEIVNYVPFGDGQSLVQVTVNDVAITSLPTAPIDDATGLPIPTIAVATDGGVSVITDSGNVWDITENVQPGGFDYDEVAFSPDNRLLIRGDGDGDPQGKWIGVFEIPTADVTYAFYTDIGINSSYYATYNFPGGQLSQSNVLVLTPAPQGGNGQDVCNAMVVGGNNVYAGDTTGLGIGTLDDFKSTDAYNPNMVAHITTNSNTGWIPSQNVLTTLSDTTEETIGSVDYSDTSPADGPELISNGTFDTDTTGWTAVNSTIESDTGRLKVTNTSAGVYGDATFTFSVTANEEYYINWEAVAGTGSIFIQILGQGDDTGYISAVPTSSTYFYPTSSGDVTITVRVTELSTSAVPVDAGDYAFIDNISVVQKNDIIYNGRFDGGLVGWTLAGDTTPTLSGGGVLLTTGASVDGSISQTISPSGNNNLKVSWEVVSNVGGEFGLYLNGSLHASGITTSGSLIVPPSITSIEFRHRVEFSGVIDNISVVETTELIANGEFTYNTTGWTFEGTGTDTSAPGYLEYTAGAAVNTCATQAINTEIGKLYYVEADFVSGTSNGAIYIGTSAFGTDVGSTQFELGGNKIFNTFKATTTTTYISLIVGSGTETGRFDNVSVKEADELVENGDFGRLTTGWTAENANPGISVSNGQLTVDDTNDGGNDSKAYQDITTEVGKTYVMSFDKISTTSLFYFAIGTPAAYNSIYYSGSLGTTTGPHSHTFVATDTTTRISLITGSTGVTVYDNVSVRLAEVDRSTYQDGLQIRGQLTKSVVAPGAELVAYSGFSSSNYLKQPYNSNLNFGTGDFCLMTWVKMSNNTSFNRIVQVSNLEGEFDYAFLGQETNGDFRFQTDLSSGANIAFVNDIGTAWTLVVGVRRGDTNEIYINGVLQNSIAQAVTDDSFDFTSGVVTIGNNDDATIPAQDATIALTRISATAPTAAQIKKIYEDERKLFQEDAKCTIYGSSDAVTALAYDDKYKQLHVGTSAGRSVFNGLVRAENTTTAVATAISANNKMVAEQ